MATTSATLSLLPNVYTAIGADHPVRPPERTSRMHRSSPESQGIPSKALIDFLEAVEAKLDSLHSIMIARNGRVVVEGWWTPYSADLNHWLFSLSKSFTSTGVGIASAEGLIDLDDKVISFFPRNTPDPPGDNLKAMTVRDLLKMTHGHHGNADHTVMRSDDPNWTRKWLAFDVDHAPGTHWAYCNSASYMLSAIVQKVTGERLVDYLKPKLFEPLGIANPVWDESPEGISLGGSGLRITTEDILRFGQLYLQQGAWEGTQILPETWVAEATSLQAATPPGDHIKGWGYNFTIFPEQEAFGSGGVFGQNCYIIPETNTVIAITAGVSRDQMQTVSKLVWKHLLPAMRNSPLTENVVASTDLSEILSRLTLSTIEGSTDSPSVKTVLGRTYTFPANDRGLESTNLESTSNSTRLTLTNADGTPSTAG